MESILSSIIVGVLSLIGVVITNSSNNKELTNSLKTAQAVTDEKLDRLAQEVRRHNEFAVRVPVMETQIKNIYHELSELTNKGA